jgi:hypothetical protein
MDEMDEIQYRLRISKLEAKLPMRQIEATALPREIHSPLTSAPRRPTPNARFTAPYLIGAYSTSDRF